MSDFQPSVINCRTRRCPHLIDKTVDTAAGSRTVRVCKITGKVPGNMSAIKECEQ